MPCLYFLIVSVLVFPIEAVLFLLYLFWKLEIGNFLIQIVQAPECLYENRCRLLPYSGNSGDVIRWIPFEPFIINQLFWFKIITFSDLIFVIQNSIRYALPKSQNHHFVVLNQLKRIQVSGGNNSLKTVYFSGFFTNGANHVISLKSGFFKNWYPKSS